MSELDTDFAAGLRGQLVDTARGVSRLAIRTRRRRILTGIGLGTAAALLLTAGALVVAGGIPGSHVLTPLGADVTGSFTGTSTVELGPRPEGANAVKFSITCTSAGEFLVTYPDTHGPSGISWECAGVAGPKESTPDDPYDMTLPVGHTTKVPEIPLAAGQTSFDVTTDPGTTWTITAKYIVSVTTAWGVNANGQTYGTANEKGTPDLEAVQATNGRIGYSYASDFMAAANDGDTFPVYESDGETVIGEFRIDNGEFRIGNG